MVVVACGGPTPSTSPSASLLPGPSDASAFPTALPSKGAFEPMAYPAAPGAPCEEATSADPAFGPYEGSLKRIVARDPLTVVFELCDADPAFLAKIASPALAIDDTAERVLAVYAVNALADRGLDVAGFEPLILAPVEVLENGRAGGAEDGLLSAARYSIEYNRVAWSERAAAALERAGYADEARKVRAGLQSPWKRG